MPQDIPIKPYRTFLQKIFDGEEQFVASLDTFNIQPVYENHCLQHAGEAEIAPVLWRMVQSRGKLIAETAATHNVLGQQLWALLNPKVKANVIVEAFGLRGCIDNVLHYNDKIVPAIIKNRKSGRWKGHKMHMAILMLMLQEQLQKPVRGGIISYSDKDITVMMNPFLHDDVSELINEARQFVSDPAIPPKAEPAKCKACTFQKQCN